MDGTMAAIVPSITTEVQRTFMLTYVMFMLVIQCHFPQFVDRLGISVQA